jgi:hypothetical protein
MSNIYWHFSVTCELVNYDGEKQRAYRMTLMVLLVYSWASGGARPGYLWTTPRAPRPLTSPSPSNSLGTGALSGRVIRNQPVGEPRQRLQGGNGQEYGGAPAVGRNRREEDAGRCERGAARAELCSKIHHHLGAQESIRNSILCGDYTNIHMVSLHHPFLALYLDDIRVLCIYKAN